MSDKRDWQADMKLCEDFQRGAGWATRDLIADQPQMSIYWLQHYSTEKERADKIEAHHNSFLTVVREATEHMSWRNEGNGTEIALKLIYKWLEDHPGKEALE